MTDQPTKRANALGISVTEMVVWVAGIAAFLGLFGEFLRRIRLDQGGGLVLGFLLFYVIYLSLSVPILWNSHRVVIPATLLISSVLWTLSLQLTEHAPVGWSIASLLSVPMITAFLIARLLPEESDPVGLTEPDECPSPVQILLARGKRLGCRPALDKPRGWHEL